MVGFEGSFLFVLFVCLFVVVVLDNDNNGFKIKIIIIFN